MHYSALHCSESYCTALDRTTRLTINGKIIETVKDIKLLGTVITDNLKWDKNTKYLIKKAYIRMELLRKMTNVTKSKEDKLHIYKTYI